MRDQTPRPREEPDPERFRCTDCGGTVFADVASQTGGRCPECYREEMRHEKLWGEAQEVGA